MQAASVQIPDGIAWYPRIFDIRDHADSFEDPDGDTLQFVLQGRTAVPGLSVSGTTIQGVLTSAGHLLVDLTVGDGRGGQLQLLLPLTLRINNAPFVSRHHQTQVYATSTPVVFDASKGNVVLTDFDGHALTCEVTLRSAPAGFTVTGTQVSGVFAEPGFVRGLIRTHVPHRGAEDLAPPSLTIELDDGLHGEPPVSGVAGGRYDTDPPRRLEGVVQETTDWSRDAPPAPHRVCS